MQKMMDRFSIFILFLNVNNLYIYIYILRKIGDNFAALLKNLYFVHELILRVVIFVYYIKNILFFIYLNQKKEIYTTKILHFNNLDVFYKFNIKPFNYFNIYTFSDFNESEVFLECRKNIESFFEYISKLVDFEFLERYYIFSTKINDAEKDILQKTNQKIFFDFLVFMSYTYSAKNNKLSYVFSNNLSKLYNFIYLDFSEINAFKFKNLQQVKVEEVLEYTLSSILIAFHLFVQHCYLGFYRTLTFSVSMCYHIFILLPLDRLDISFSNAYAEISNEKWIGFKFNFFRTIQLYFFMFVKAIVDSIVQYFNDLKYIAHNLEYSLTDFTILDSVKYLFFLLRNNKFFNFHDLTFFSFQRLEEIFYKLKRIAFAFLHRKYNYNVNEILFLIYPYFQNFYIFSFSIKFLFFIILYFLKTLFKYSFCYVAFFKEFYCALEYFFHLFYCFFSSCFFSEHIIAFILLEFCLELVGIRINSIEFVISLIFIIICSIVTSQVIDMFENYNLDILIETFSFFYFCFSFLYDQQKLLLSFLKTKIRIFELLKPSTRIGLKLKEISKQNLKITILLEKIKKLKIK